MGTPTSSVNPSLILSLPTGPRWPRGSAVSTLGAAVAAGTVGLRQHPASAGLPARVSEAERDPLCAARGELEV